jgi:hypothetical protein
MWNDILLHCSQVLFIWMCNIIMLLYVIIFDIMKLSFLLKYNLKLDKFKLILFLYYLKQLIENLYTKQIVL